MDQPGDTNETAKKPLLSRNLRAFVIAIPYLIIFLFLSNAADFPDSFGITVARGRGGVFEEWWYSYLLIRRGSIIDILTFIYMWAPIVGWIGWLIWSKLKNTKGKPFKISLFDDETPSQ